MGVNFFLIKIFIIRNFKLTFLYKKSFDSEHASTRNATFTLLDLVKPIENAIFILKSEVIGKKFLLVVPV